ncbi:MAG: hypothetical protein R3C05_02320 [Pirellulaceae bacterium]
MQLPLRVDDDIVALDAMEQLWASLSPSPDYTPPTWHADILAEHIIAASKAAKRRFRRSKML